MSDYKGTSVVIKRSRFLDNKATDAAGQGGGALYAQSAHPLSISGSLFAGNSSAVGGGAIAQHLASVFTVAGSTFIGNSAAGSGGAIAVHDGALFTMKGSTLSGNSGIAGGAIYANAGAHLTASGNKFTENKSTSVGGAIATSGVGAAAVPVALSGNLFSANVATAGGAIQSIGDGSVTMKGDKVLGNVTTASDGGGLYLASTTGITLTGLLVQGNHSFDDAGGIKITGTATLTGCKVLENIADYGDGRGGGIFVFAGTVVIAKSTVTGNVAATGGGIFDLDATTIPGTKVTGNSARTDPNTHGIP
jgi:predicted outer membrane repeat protein